MLTVFCSYKPIFLFSEFETIRKVLIVFFLFFFKGCEMKYRSHHHNLAATQWHHFPLFASILRASAAACATPSRLSLKQNLFHSCLEPLEALTPLLDISNTPTEQELLVHKVLQSLEDEKTESKRFVLSCFCLCLSLHLEFSGYRT